MIGQIIAVDRDFICFEICVSKTLVLYRIEKIYKVTGLNIRNFEDAMSFKLLTIVYNNMKDRTGRK